MYMHSPNVIVLNFVHYITLYVCTYCSYMHVTAYICGQASKSGPSWHTLHLITKNRMLNKNTQGAKKGEANQK